jgi:hypothetical protein
MTTIPRVEETRRCHKNVKATINALYIERTAVIANVSEREAFVLDALFQDAGYSVIMTPSVNEASGCTTKSFDVRVSDPA